VLPLKRLKEERKPPVSTNQPRRRNQRENKTKVENSRNVTRELKLLLKVKEGDS